LDINIFLFGALPIDTLKIKHTKKMKEIPSRDALENLPKKASMYAFIHLKLIGNLQGFCQYIMAHTSPREDSTSKVVYCQFLFRNP